MAHCDAFGLASPSGHATSPFDANAAASSTGNMD